MSARALLFAAALAAALPPAAAFAQASPSAGTHAVRYDLMRREVGTISPDADGAAPFSYLATRKTYDPAGRLTRVESGALSSWQSEAVAPADWTGFTVHAQVDTAYDSMNRKVRESASGGGVVSGVTEYGYDLAGRLRCTAVRMNPDAWATELGDKCVPGPVHAVHGPDRITRNGYNVHGELLKVESAVGTPLAQVYAAYTYSPNGKALSVTDANGNRAEMTWDGLDRQKRWIFPSKTVPGEADAGDYEEYGYDSNANRTSLRKRDGSTLGYQYDALNRVSVKIVPERTGLDPVHSRDVHYEYDLRGLMTKARFDSIAGEGIANGWDGFGQLVSSSSDMGGTARATGNVYDADGNRIRVVHPDGSYFTYDLDGLGRPTWIRENGGAPVTYFSYDSAGRRASSAWGMSTYGYDPAGRLQSLTHNPDGSTRDHELAFTYNPASQVQTRSASNDAYAWGGGGDVVRLHSVNGLNQYTSAGPATFGHDLNGNLASTANAPHTTAYVYDIENRLVSASGSHNATLTYDPLGRLWQVSSGSSVRRLVYDGDALVAEYDSAGNMPHRYIHGNEAGGDDPLVWYDNFAAGWRQVLLTDHQGSVIGVTDMYGRSIATNSYDPWGIPAAANAGRFGYTGQTWVPELGLWYYKARFYSPTTGRFLQVDPVGYKDQMNLYAYVANDPANHTDATGTVRCEGNSHCGEVHRLANEARGRAQVASAELRALATAMQNGSALSNSQQSLLGAFEEKFGEGADAQLISSVAGRIDRIAERIGAEGEGVRINFGSAKGAAIATAVRGGNSLTIRPLFFAGPGGVSRTSVIFHEVGHSIGMKDRKMPEGAPSNIGRESRGEMRGYGISATNWLGANDPERARRNNDNYNCYVNPDCGGP